MGVHSRFSPTKGREGEIANLKSYTERLSFKPRMDTNQNWPPASRTISQLFVSIRGFPKKESRIFNDFSRKNARAILNRQS